MTGPVLLPPPWRAPAPGRWQERYASPGEPERRLRLLLVGHNPSEVAWSGGHFYGNPTNRMWHLLRVGGIIPQTWDVPADHRMPLEVGVGFTDVGCEPGNDVSVYDRDVMRAWKADLFLRLKAHVLRVWRPELVLADRWEADAGEVVEGLWAELPAGGLDLLVPPLVAFTGKRQWAQLFDPPLGRCEVGVQSLLIRPGGWPLGEAEVWVLPSSSGRAAMSAAERLAPYAALGRRLRGLPWRS